MPLPAGLREAGVSFRGAGGLALQGSVISAADAPPGRPGVVLVHGAGTGTPREKLLGEAVEFARQGLSVLIYDKRSEGYSRYSRSYVQLADDAAGAVEVLRRQPGVDPAKVGVWGLSEGGWVAPLAATRSDGVAFVIVVGGNALQPLRQQTWAVAAGLRKAGVGGSLVERAEPTMYRVIADGGLFPEPYYDAEATLAKVRQPVLAIWGVHDLLTPPVETPPIFARALESGGNRRYTFRFFDGDHAAHRTPDGGVTRLPELASGYPELVGSWVRDATAGRAPVARVSGPDPVQADDSVGVPPTAWWESAPVQAIVLVLLVAGFLSCPAVAVARRLRRRRPGADARVRGAAVVSGAGLVVTVGGLAYAFTVFMQGGKLASPGPMLGDRPVLWLLLQLLAVVTAVATVLTALARRRVTDRGARLRAAVLVATGALFVPWAFYWGLLLP